MLFITVFVVSWYFILFVSDKRKLRDTYPTVLLAMAMSLGSDSLLRFAPLWDYHDVDTSLPESIYTFLDDFGIYPAIAIFYLQLAPARAAAWLGYTFLWSLAGIALEFIMLRAGYMTYGEQWSLRWSYAADWGIFVLLAIHNRLVQRYSRRPRIHVDRTGSATVTFSQPLASMEHSSLMPNFVSRPGREMFLGIHDENVEFIFWTLSPGESVSFHTHEGYEIHYIVEGELGSYQGGREETIAQGEMVSFSSRTPHGFVNAGTDTARLMSIEIREQALVSPLLDMTEPKKQGHA